MRPDWALGSPCAECLPSLAGAILQTQGWFYQMCLWLGAPKAAHSCPLLLLSPAFILPGDL